ncbi:MAG: hypothetical protein ABJA67_01795 [Chthonomonadales bacterium]
MLKVTKILSGLCVFIVLSTIIGCGGGGGSSPLGLSRVAVDAGRAGKKTIGPDGGTVAATSASGVVYTLTIPAGALAETTDIGLYPVNSISSFPFANGMTAGFHLTPEGLYFSKPATLVVNLTSAVTADAVAGFAYSGDGAEIHQYPMDVSGSILTFSILHFSGGGAGRTPAPACSSSGSAQAIAECKIAVLLNNQTQVPTANQIADVLLAWYNATVKPGLQSVTTDPTPLAILDEYHAWSNWSSHGSFPPSLQTGVALILVPQLADADTAAITGMKSLIASYNQNCSLQSAKNALRVMRRAVSWNLGQSSGLSRDAVLSNLCVQATVTQQDFPQTINAGTSGTLQLKVGYTIGGGATQFDQPFTVNVTPSGTTSDTPVSGTTNNGAYQKTVTRLSDSTQLRLDINACFADVALRDICTQVFIIRGTSANWDQALGTGFIGTVTTVVNNIGPDAPHLELWSLEKKSDGTYTFIAWRLHDDGSIQGNFPVHQMKNVTWAPPNFSGDFTNGSVSTHLMGAFSKSSDGTFHLTGTFGISVTDPDPANSWSNSASFVSQ